jgi:PAS domain-containing protein
MELVLRGAEVGVWYCPLPFDKLIWDERVKEHFHLPPNADVTIDTFYERLHPEDRERTRTAIERSIEARTSYDIDYRTVSADGTATKWIRAVGRTFYGRRLASRCSSTVFTVDVHRAQGSGSLRCNGTS